MPNYLATESSPYLRQHADNPVDWYPWHEEALTRAVQEDKPILLSIGYSACHWCHVMAHESFEDSATAAVMNEHFVNIKVDREERPDLDSIYMQAVQAMTGQGGWPMTVFLTPAGMPFYGGTYFPPTDRYGMPSFTKVLRAVAEAYRTRRESVLKSAESVHEMYIKAAQYLGGEELAPDEAEDWPERLTDAYRAATRHYDAQHGGFGSAPKFPSTMVLDFLLRHWARTGTEHARDMAHESFIKMARGGIYDQIGGGFARYAVDAEWLVPHFEKMLYDNALLVRFGAHLFQATKDDEVRRVTEETVRWLLREMMAPDGGLYSALDADSEGHEGKFYLWDVAELDALLGDDAALVKTYYGVTPSGNFEGRNILHVPSDLSVMAAKAGVSEHAMRAAITRAKQTLYDARAKRIWPHRDNKILAGWNGLALRGLADAANLLGLEEAKDGALRVAQFLSREMIHHGRVMRTHARGVTRIPGVLEDHAAVALGFLAVFELTADTQWLLQARQLADATITWFWDDAIGTFFDTAHDAPPLITRPRDITDNAIPSGTSLAVELLLRLATYLDRADYRECADRILNALSGPVTRHPLAFGHLLGAAEYSVTFACHGEYCDMPSPRTLELARTLSKESTHA